MYRAHPQDSQKWRWFIVLSIRIFEYKIRANTLYVGRVSKRLLALWDLEPSGRVPFPHLLRPLERFIKAISMTFDILFASFGRTSAVVTWRFGPVECDGSPCQHVVSKNRSNIGQDLDKLSDLDLMEDWTGLRFDPLLAGPAACPLSPQCHDLRLLVLGW
ncbi:hypothetical protein Tco_1228990 [Tanacetum coccineum]